MQQELKRKDERNEQLSRDLAQKEELVKQNSEKAKKEFGNNQKKLKSQVEEMTKKIEEKEAENARLQE